MRQIIKFVCEHCNREYRVKENAEHHESICWKNKDNRTCITCKYFGGIINSGYGDYFLCNCEKGEEDDYKPDETIPREDCEFWDEDKRTKKQRIEQWNKRYSSKGEMEG